MMIQNHCALLILVVIVLICQECVESQPIYKVTSLVRQESTIEGYLQRTSGRGPYGKDIDNLKFVAELINVNTVKVKIVDSEEVRWQVPRDVLHQPDHHPPGPSSHLLNWHHSDVNYRLILPDIGDNFFFKVQSRSGKPYTMFDSSDQPFVFSDQYIQIGTKLPGDRFGKSPPNLYGLGERHDRLRLGTNNKTYTIWNHDWYNTEGLHSYGAHPFYLELRDQQSHGVFLLNSNAMDIQVNWMAEQSSNQNLTYKVIGGILEFYFFVGPTPELVLQQYHELIGYPSFPPLRMFGFHQSRWGYATLKASREVVAKYKEHGIPLEFIWNDIDYMDEFAVFTYSDLFPLQQMNQLIEELEKSYQGLIVILDPGIAIGRKNYPALDLLLQRNLYVKQLDGKNPAVNKVWPGCTVFPDFTNTETQDYWIYMIHKYVLDQVRVSGLWIDMNEPSTFCNGGQSYLKNDECLCNTTNLEANAISRPPYVPGPVEFPLNNKTIPLDSIASLSSFYNVHNLYSHYESLATAKALQTHKSGVNKRHFCLTRSTFAGTGKYCAHWTGDNHSSWLDLKLSIPGILSMNMFGIPMVGADICGFEGSTTPELCLRWIQLGSFYMFSRNHHSRKGAPQELYILGETVARVSRKVLLQRYSLLQHFYTLYYHTTKSGGSVTRPLFFEFSSDEQTYGIDEQFLIGPSLLISPTLLEGHRSVKAYFPKGRWYDLNIGKEINTCSSGSWLQLDAPLDHINVHLRGGYIIARQIPDMTVTEMQFNSFILYVALNDPLVESTHEGELYLDDGISADTANIGAFTHIAYRAEWISSRNSQQHRNFIIFNKLIHNGYASINKYEPMRTIFVYGLKEAPYQVALNERVLDQSSIEYDRINGVLSINNLRLSLPMEWTLKVFLPQTDSVVAKLQ